MVSSLRASYSRQFEQSTTAAGPVNLTFTMGTLIMRNWSSPPPVPARFNSSNIWYFLHQALLDAHLDRYHRAWARYTSSLQLQPHHIPGNLMKGNISSVCLQIRSHLIQNKLDISSG